MATFSGVSFEEKLDQRVKTSDSLLCIGLDPHISQLPSSDAQSAVNFCLEIIGKTAPYAAAFKPNSAFFEIFGSAGIDALVTVLKSIPTDIPVILDCKRGDIDTTAQAYAGAAFDIAPADAVTLNPYMGWDSLKPFLTGAYEGKGAFVLCKTSNPSAKDFQTICDSSGIMLYEKVAQLSSVWATENPRSCIGLVAGATDLIALGRVRVLCPQTWILCPGVGAQGGEADKVCAAGLRSDGSGLLVSVSRGISKAKDMALAAKELRDEINHYRKLAIASKAAVAAAAPGPAAITDELQDFQIEFLRSAIDQKVLKFGQFTLKSGRLSPYFFNAGLFSSGSSLGAVCRAYAHAIRSSGVEFDVFFGPAYKGIPLAASIAIAWFDLFGESKDFSYNRKEVKDHGEGGSLVGAAVSGRRVLIVDDVITAGTAIRESVQLLRSSDATLVAVAVCLDRQEKTAETSTRSAIQEVESEYNIPVLSIVKLRHLIQFLKTTSIHDTGAAAIFDWNEIDAYRIRYGIDY